MRWPIARLGTISKINPRPPLIPLDEDEVAFVPMSSVSDDGTMEVKEYKSSSLLKGNYSYFQDGDLLVAKITPCFENKKISLASINRLHAFGSTEFHVIRVEREKLNARYLLHFLRQDIIRAKGESRMTGSAGQRRVPRLFLEELEITLPSLEEQQRISDILDHADDLRMKRRESLETLNALLQADFINAFTKKASTLWPEVTIAEMSRSIRTGPFGSQLLHSEFVDEGVAVLGIDNAVLNEFSWDERRFITEKKFSGLARYRVFPRDIIITIMGTCGRVAVVPGNIPAAITTKHLCCLTLDEERCLPEFLHACFLRHPEVLRQLGVSERGAVMPGLNMQLIKETRIPLPPLDLQRAFAARVAEIDKLKVAHRAHLTRLDELFASLQHRAFRGEL